MYLPPPAWYVILFSKLYRRRVAIVVYFHGFLFWSYTKDKFILKNVFLFVGIVASFIFDQVKVAVKLNYFSVSQMRTFFWTIVVQVVLLDRLMTALNITFFVTSIILNIIFDRCIYRSKASMDAFFFLSRISSPTSICVKLQCLSGNIEFFYVT